MKETVIAKLSSQCEELYAEVLKLFQKELLQPLWDRDWIPTVSQVPLKFMTVCRSKL